MHTRIYWINEKVIGENLLGIMPRPRGGDWLEDEIDWMKRKGIDYLISLLEKEEINELGLEHQRKLCEKYGLEYLNFPIKDVSVPRNDTEYLQLVNQLVENINQSKKVVIHCRMGIGRSSILASCILISKGVKVEGVFDKLSTYRELKVPDTIEQENWVMNISERIGKIIEEGNKK